MSSCMTPAPTPIDSLPSYFSARPFVNTADLTPGTPGKRLRSCLSPTRTPTGSSTPARATGSRAASFSSDNGSIGVGGERGTKSVRFDETDEGEAVTSYHSTYSAAEYDRTPLPPPSAAERTCVLPERGSRTFSTDYDCFDDCPTPSFGSSISDDASPDEIPSSPAEEIANEALFSPSPTRCEGEDEYPAGEEDDERDREWEICVERRRMMFALQTKSDEHERQPEFEGYRSISSKLVDMLRSIEARREPSPEEEDKDETDEERPVEAESEDEEENPNYRSFSSFTFTNLQSLNIRSTPLDNVLEEGTEEGSDIDLEATTPSLISSLESEADVTLTSPQTSVAAYPSSIAGLPAVPFALHRKESGLVGRGQVAGF